MTIVFPKCDYPPKKVADVDRVAHERAHELMCCSTAAAWVSSVWVPVARTMIAHGFGLAVSRVGSPLGVHRKLHLKMIELLPRVRKLDEELASKAIVVPGQAEPEVSEEAAKAASDAWGRIVTELADEVLRLHVYGRHPWKDLVGYFPWLDSAVRMYRGLPRNGRKGV